MQISLLNLNITTFDLPNSKDFMSLWKVDFLGQIFKFSDCTIVGFLAMQAAWYMYSGWI
jgi:hypothetical protein